ncbi:uncharacterized protein LOC143246434 isoform X1 [Tachypleus tridentatus]|uniref:uncharacterized protein LOC143246434 isoform X1 n=1 Tax=Tachypleus tridentatus TaxID=6853 RepID=UPI003FD47A8E
MNYLRKLRGRKDGILAVFGGFLIHVCMGYYLTFGNITTYMTSYLKLRVDDSITYTRTLWILSTCIIGRALPTMLGGYLEQKIGTRWPVAVGCLFFSLSVFLTSWLIDDGFEAVVMVYGLLQGFGLGLDYVPTLVTPAKWFSGNTGLATAFVSCGFGVGPLIFNNVITSYVNPENISPNKDGYFTDADLLDRLPYVLLILAGVLTFFQVTACILLKPHPDFDKNKNLFCWRIRNKNSKKVRSDLDRNVTTLTICSDGTTNDNTVSRSNDVTFIKFNQNVCSVETHSSTVHKESPSEVPSDFIETNQLFQTSPVNSEDNYNDILVSSKDDYKYIERGKQDFEPASGCRDIKHSEYLTTKEALRKKEFYIIMGFLFLQYTVNLYFTSFYKTYGQTFIEDDSYLGVVSSFTGLMNACGKFTFGSLLDRLGFRKVVGFIIFLSSFIAISFPATQYGGKLMWTMWTTLYYFLVSGIWPILPVATAQVFGRNNSSTIYGIAIGFPMMLNILGTLAISKLHDHFGWYGAYGFIGGMGFLSFLLVLLFPEDPEAQRRIYVEEKNKRSEKNVPD